MAEIILNRTTRINLPYSFTYTPDHDNEVILMLSGSAWSSTQSRIIGITLEIDGEDVCTAEIYSNGPSTHRLLMPGIVKHHFNLKFNETELLSQLENNDASYIPTPQPVNMTIKVMNGDTNFDVNDYISLTLL